MVNIPFERKTFAPGITALTPEYLTQESAAIEAVVDKTKRAGKLLHADVCGPDDVPPVPTEAISGPNVASDLYKNVTIATKLGARRQHERATGGKQTILWDKNDNESIHFVIPKCNVEDLFGSTLFCAGLSSVFFCDGAEKSVLFYPVYKAVKVGALACSLDGGSPWTSVSFDDARAACVNKNRAGETGWHMCSVFESALVRLWCLRNGFQPRGNTNYGRAHDATHESGLRHDKATPGITGGTPRTLNGTGPATWRHDGTPSGIADLVGNCREWLDGFKIVDGQIYLPSSRDNFYDQPEAAWTPTGVFFDSSGTTGTDETSNVNGEPILSGVRQTPSDDCGDGLGQAAPDYDFTRISGESGARSVTMSESYDALPLATRQLMMQLFVAHKLNNAATAPFAAKGYISVRNYGERLPYVGGDWNSGANAGLAALNLSYRRSYVNTSIGFRPAFLL